MSYCCRPKVTKHDLVKNTSGGKYVDTKLVNAWGIVTYGENIYVCSRGTDILIRYDLCGNNPYYINLCDENGTTLSNETSPIVRPTGITVNSTNGYLVSDGTGANIRKSTLLIASESGDLFGYNPQVGGGQIAYRIYAGSAIVSATPFYTGIAVTDKYLFATDFVNGNIDVFEDIHTANNIRFKSHINIVLSSPYFTSPFNVVSLHGMLYVIYANKASASSSIANGGGSIDVRNSYGVFVRYFNSCLASPWGLTKAPKSLYCPCETLLVSNHQTGQITAHDKFGHRIGEMYNDNKCAVSINCLWGIYTHNEKIYFSAGPNNGSNGLVGYLEKKLIVYDPCEMVNPCDYVISDSCSPCKPCKSANTYYFC